MPPVSGKNLDEILRLTQENNKMLHAMRRNAFLGGIFKLLIYAAMVLVPIWLYMQYLAPVVTKTLDTVNQIQATSGKAQAQMSDWQKALLELRAKIPGLSSTSTR